MEAKNETIRNLMRQTDQQMQSTIESKMELIELKTKTGLELDIEAGMRLKEALLRAGATVVGEEMSSQPRRQITRSDLFTAQLTGCAGSQERRKKLLHQLDLPEHLSTKALLQVLNQLMSYEEYTKVIQTL